jgi:hypothetical protein
LSFQFPHETEKTKPKTHVCHVHTFDLFDYVGHADRNVKKSRLDPPSHKASAYVKTSAYAKASARQVGATSRPGKQELQA